MKVKKTKIDGVLILEPTVHEDDRGYFFESYNRKTLQEIGITTEFVQDNEAKSLYGVIRGLHYQKDNYAQAKLIRVTQGRVLDVILDIRKNSKTYGRCISIVISAKNKKQIFIPRGLAHGYSVLSSTAVFNYKCDNYYYADYEAGVNPLDSNLKIDWKIDSVDQIISTKDKSWPGFDL